MKKMFCSECGGEIILTREVPSHSFQIHNNSLKCIDNYGFMGGDPELVFHCINDNEHDIDPRPDSGVPASDFYDWMEEVEQFFKDNVLEHI